VHLVVYHPQATRAPQPAQPLRIRQRYRPPARTTNGKRYRKPLKALLLLRRQSFAGLLQCDCREAHLDTKDELPKRRFHNLQPTSLSRMDPSACRVIYIDDRFNTERWISREGLSAPPTPQRTNAQANFGELPADLQANVNAFLTVFNQGKLEYRHASDGLL
jgi:hypothetical protein